MHIRFMLALVLIALCGCGKSERGQPDADPKRASMSPERAVREVLAKRCKIAADAIPMDQPVYDLLGKTEPMRIVTLAILDISQKIRADLTAEVFEKVAGKTEAAILSVTPAQLVAMAKLADAEPIETTESPGKLMEKWTADYCRQHPIVVTVGYHAIFGKFHAGDRIKIHGVLNVEPDWLWINMGYVDRRTEKGVIATADLYRQFREDPKRIGERFGIDMAVPEIVIEGRIRELDPLHFGVILDPEN
jgi:hypothetical protein